MSEENFNKNELNEEIGDFLNSGDIFQEFENNLLNYALHYAKLGYPVFPLHNIIKKNGFDICSCNKEESCTTQGKHPRTRNGHKDATTDEGIIIDWWEQHPDANIGLVTGIESGILVLDIDTKNDGESSLADLDEYYKNTLSRSGNNYEPTSESLVVQTGSGGRHIYYKYPLDFKIKGSISKIGVGLDIRANGNYVVAPPSRHISGNNYQWYGMDTEIKNAPRWLIYKILKADEQSFESTDSAVSTSKKVTNKIKDGEGRYEFFYKYICGLVRSFSKMDVLKRAFDKNQEILDPPYPKEKVEYIVNDLYKRYGKFKTSY